MAEPDVAELAGRAIAIAEQAAQTQRVIVRTQEAIVRQQMRTKRTTWWLAVTVALDITLSVVIILLAVGQAGTSDSIRQSQLNGCAIGNTFRASQVTLWDHVLAVSAHPAHETPFDRERRLATVAAFRAYVRHQFRPVNCTRLYGK